MTDPLLGTSFDGWKVVAPLGQGAMGTVYEVRKGADRGALKVIHPENASQDALPRFRREAKLLSQVRHPCVVGCLGTGEREGLTWLLLELMEGGTLEELLEEQGRFTPPQAIGAARAVLQGLGAIHEKGVVHRDVKPANLLLDGAGKVKVGDLGLARKGEASSLTATGTILGTPYYMAPEQCRGEELDGRTDLYAVGVLLWHLITGQPPYEAKNPLAILQLHMTADVPDLRKVVPEAPPRLAQAIGRLMAKSPGDRPRDAKAALELLSGLPDAPLPRRRRRPSGSGSRRPGSSSDGGTQVAALVEPGGRSQQRRSPSDSGAQLAALPGARPLPPVPTSRTWNLIVALLGLVGLLAAADAGYRMWQGADPLQPLHDWLVGMQDELARTGESGFRPQVVDALEALTIALGWARPHLDQWSHVWGSIVGVLLLDRLLARFARLGLFARLWLRSRARTLRLQGEIHAAAKVYEQLGDRARGGELLLAHDLPLPAAEMFAAAGLTQRQGDALMVAGRKREALLAYRASGSESMAVDAAQLGDTSRDSVRILLEQGKVEDAIHLHRRAGRRYDAADLLERAGRLDEAVQELEAAYAAGGGRDYWHHTGKKGPVEEARLALSRRIGGLWEKLGKEDAAATYFEKSGDLDDACRLYERTGDKRSLARCLLVGIPAQGELSGEHRQRVDQAARALSELGDAAAVELFLRVGRLRDAAELKARLGEHIEAARLFGRVKAFAEGAPEAEKGGDLGLAARLWADAGQFMRASELFEKVGALDDAAATARRAGNREREVSLLQRSGKHFAAAKVLQEGGQPEAALKALAPIKKDSDKWADARQMAGDIYLQLGRAKEAAAAYEQGVPEKIHFAEEAPGLLGWVGALEALGEYEKALGLLGRLDGKEFAPRDLAKRKARLQGLREQGAAPSGVVHPSSRGTPRPAGPSETARGGSATSAMPAQPAPAPASAGGTTMAQVSPQLLTGKTLGNYELLRYVGEGSFAWVFEGRHAALGREAAIKVLKPNLASKDAAERFIREGRSLAALKNPHLVEVYDMGEAEGLSYIALEFVKGPTLKKLIADEAPFPIARAARLGAELLDALGAAHKSGVVHRDLKPANVLIGRDTKVKVLDFGLARVFDEGDKSATGAYVGTPRYASPEQARGEEAHEPADQYAAALLIYEMLTGKLPFTSKTTLGYLSLHASEPPKPLLELRPDVPPELAAAIMRALEKNPADRFPTVGELERVVSRFATRPRPARSS